MNQIHICDLVTYYVHLYIYIHILLSYSTRYVFFNSPCVYLCLQFNFVHLHDKWLSAYGISP